MRSRPSWPSARVLLWLALLFPAAPGDAGAGDPPPPGAVLGTILRDSDGAPVPYANVVETTIGLAATSDERGRFLLFPVPAGRVAIRIQALGGPPLVETFDLAPGDTVRRTYRLAAPAHERFLHVRDSLSALGLWPPTLDAVLLAHMREALDVRVFRLDPDHPVHDAPPDPQSRMGPWPIVGEARTLDRAVIDDLLQTLRHSELYLPDIQGVKKLCGEFSPGIGVRFNNGGVTAEVLLCYTCGEFSISRGGRRRQEGDFGGREADFVRFAKRMFPKDPAFKRLSARLERPSR
jgi:carboxypeptidase family protein